MNTDIHKYSYIGKRDCIVSFCTQNIVLLSYFYNLENSVIMNCYNLIIKDK